MKRHYLLVFVFGWVVGGGLDSTAVKGGEPGVPCWQPHDFKFAAESGRVNPFRVVMDADVTGPGGRGFTLPGFYDGNGTWKVRVSPTVEGRWTLTTKSGLPELNNRRVEFTCVGNANPNIHGVLRVDKAHPHHFIFDDGTRFFMQGYEYDWLWALDLGKPGVPTVEKSLDLIARQGFDCVILDSYAYDTQWRPGRSGRDDYGPPALCPWAGDNAHPDHTRMNPAYWRHYDRVMSALLDRGMEAHILIKVYNKGVHWPAHNSPAERLFFRWLIARYAAYPNVIWDFSKEAQREQDLAYKQGWLRYLRKTDPYHHLVTVHDDDRAYESGAYDGLVDFRADQQHRNWHQTILRERASRDWPVVNVESDYECGPGGITDKTYGRAQSPEETVRTAWAIAMAGGFTVYYYTYTAWDVIRPLAVPPGYAYFKLFGEFWRATDYWLLQPADKLVSAGWCLADPGREYVVFQNRPGLFTLKIAEVDTPLKAQWFNPLTGACLVAGTYGNGIAHFKPPENWGSAPLVLHLAAPNQKP